MIFTILTTLLPALLGILTSALPNLVQYFERSQEYKYEIEIIKLRMEAAAQGIDVADIKTIVQEGNSIRDHDLAFSNNEFLNTVRGVIRPILTVFFFLFWLVVKLTILVIMVRNNAPIEFIIDATWDSWAQATFGAILGFWFGTRALLHMMERYQPITKITGKEF